MNSSLSTVDTLFNPIQINNSQRTGDNMDKTRASPSFNDSEPPSYFEVVGISHHNVILNSERLFTDSSNTSRISSYQQHNLRLPKISMETSPESNHNKNNPNSTVVLNCQALNRQTANGRAYNLPLSITHQNIQTSNSCANNQLNRIHEPILKPSETYLVWSIFTTIYCVFLGVPALVLSIKVYHYNKQEQYDKAYSRSKFARYFNIAGLFFGIVYMAVGIIACLIPRR